MSFEETHRRIRVISEKIGEAARLQAEYEMLGLEKDCEAQVQRLAIGVNYGHNAYYDLSPYKCKLEIVDHIMGFFEKNVRGLPQR